MKLLITEDQQADEGWVFIYEHVELKPNLKLKSRVRKGQQIASAPSGSLSSNHFELSYWKEGYLFNKTCWTDHIDSKKFVNHFKNVMRHDEGFISSLMSADDD